MVQFNFSERTIKAKVVYYGPPQSGKTTNLEQIHRISDPEASNRLISLNTAQDRTLFFDLLPFSLGTVSGYDFKIQLYTVPGQVQYNATRRVVLAGADAVVFVADAQKAMARENLSAFENMKVNLLANRLVPEKVPLVLQYNKQDLGGLMPSAELDRTLNLWGRKAFPAVAARGEGVMETFAAVVEDMLAAIAVKYNLKEKGLDPESVPEIVANAFAAIVKKAPAPAAPMPPRVVIAQPEGTEPAYPGQVGADVGPVSEELLHRAIRTNVELAEALGQVVRDVSQGLATIHAQADQVTLAREDASRGSATAAIQREVRRLQLVLRDVGQAASANRSPSPGRAASPGRAPAPPQVPSTPPRGTVAAPPPMPGPVPNPPPATPLALQPPPPPPATPALSPPPPAAPVRAPVVSSPAPASGTGLDHLVAEVLEGVRPALAERRVRVESRLPTGSLLPRCSPAGLRRAFALLVQGLAAAVTPATGILVRAEKKPVLLRGRDGSEVKRDFVMIALTHAGGLADAEQQRVLKGGDPGALGDAQRLVREMGGFMRFAPLPGGALETRVFLPS
jgi:signal recognition particle receptor subunit beta